MCSEVGEDSDTGQGGASGETGGFFGAEQVNY